MICFNETDFMCEKMDDSAAILRVESQDVFLLNISIVLSAHRKAAETTTPDERTSR